MEGFRHFTDAKHKGKLYFLALFAGLVLFIAAFVSDILQCHWLFLKGETWWCVFSGLLIIVSLLCVNIMAAKQINENVTAKCIVYILIGIIPRYLKEFEHWKRTYWENPPCNRLECPGNCDICTQHKDKKKELDESSYNFAWIRYVEAYTKSAPQLCLKAYIILSQQDISPHNCVSTTISLLSLAWTLTVIKEKEKTKSGCNFGFKRTVQVFFVLIPILLWRLSIVVWFMYVYKLHVFTALAIHAVLVNMCLLHRTGRWSEWNVYTSFISFLGFPFSSPQPTGISERVTNEYRAGLACFMFNETIIMTVLLTFDAQGILMFIIVTIHNSISHIIFIVDHDGGLHLVFTGVTLGIGSAYRIITGTTISSFGEIIGGIFIDIIRSISTFISIVIGGVIEKIVKDVLIS